MICHCPSPFKRESDWALRLCNF